MGKLTPLAVRAQTAAAMLDMPPAEFMRLVERGALPPPVRIGQHDRWNVDQLTAIIRGDAAKPNQEFEL
jgi:predicted DNA-binding transcriptional regulator AlpA